ncbi:MAG: helix-turn-helix domain-containing protein [Alphaproteobacteria bacterium]
MTNNQNYTTPEFKDEDYSLGEILKLKRQKLHIEIPTACDFLKVKSRDLIAIENNEIDKISKNIYAPGLIKSYAKYLKINQKTIEHKIKEHHFKSNTENKKHILVNIGEHLELTPKKELFVNCLVISLIIFIFSLSIFSIKNKHQIALGTNEIIDEIKKLEID